MEEYYRLAEFVATCSGVSFLTPVAILKNKLGKLLCLGIAVACFYGAYQCRKNSNVSTLKHQNTPVVSHQSDYVKE